MYRLRSISLSLAAVLSLGAVYLGYPRDAGSAVARAAEPEPSDFAWNPPALETIHITPLFDSESADALLQLRYAPGQDLPAEIPFNVGDTQVKLSRDRKDPQRYTGAIPFDFEGFIEEQEQRQKAASEGDSAPRFDGRQLIGHEPTRFLDPAELRKRISSGAVIEIPHEVHLGSLRLIRPERSLMITDTQVVEDQSRTFDACTGTGDPNGAWTFNTLVTHMSQGVDPSDFVETWFRTWETDASVNSFPVIRRPPVITQILDNWPRLTNGKLDLAHSPMRLLAIVNRMDLRANASYTSSGSAGEGRFVFGVLRKQNNGHCTVYPFTVIFEYGLPLRGCAAIRDYARQWAVLGNLPLGSPSYNASLQAVTDQFTRANAAPGKPNGSALNQIRTNENLSYPWELREFNIVRQSQQLALVPAKQTPHHSFNTSAISTSSSTLLADYANAYATQISQERHRLPLSYLGTAFQTGSVLNPETVWYHPNIVDNQVRHKLSLNTCDACHGGETQTKFLHIGKRVSGTASALSKFLIGNRSGASLATPTVYDMADGLHPATVRPYGDLLRRQADLSALRSGGCFSGGVFESVRFSPLQATH